MAHPVPILLTPDQEAYVREWHGKKLNKDMAAHLGMSQGAFSHRLDKLGIRKSRDDMARAKTAKALKKSKIPVGRRSTAFPKEAGHPVTWGILLGLSPSLGLMPYPYTPKS